MNNTRHEGVRVDPKELPGDSKLFGIPWRIIVIVGIILSASLGCKALGVPWTFITQLGKVMFISEASSLLVGSLTSCIGLLKRSSRLALFGGSLILLNVCISTSLAVMMSIGSYGELIWSERLNKHHVEDFLEFRGYNALSSSLAGIAIIVYSSKLKKTNQGNFRRANLDQG